MGAIISRILPGSIGQRFGFKIKDEIITINGQLLRDAIDYFYLTAEHKLEINFVRDGLPHITVVHKEESENLGLDFENEIFDEIKTCSNKCIFCFVDQLPKSLRSTLFIKDDDYRLSFLHGNYITLTNLAENDLRRITAQRLSPLYVSVHATDPDVRIKIMGTPGAGNILKSFEKLKKHGIQCHTQIVVVPGVNDGRVFKKTLQDLYDFYPCVRSVAIVPVGVTKHGSHGKEIRQIRPTEAKQIYEMTDKFQKKALKQYKTSLFFLSDEFYLMMGMELPRNAHYEYFDQIGNGVGMSRKMITDFNRRKRYFPESLDQKRNVWIITGVLGEKVLSPLVKEFSSIKKLKTQLIPVKNEMLGSSVTVTGLLGGQDILTTLQKKLTKSKAPDMVIFPDSTLNEDRFLDDITPQEIAEKLNINLLPVSTDAQGLIEGVIGQQSRRKKTGEIEEKSDEVKEKNLNLFQASLNEDMGMNFRKMRTVGRSNDHFYNKDEEHNNKRHRNHYAEKDSDIKANNSNNNSEKSIANRTGKSVRRKSRSGSVSRKR